MSLFRSYPVVKVVASIEPDKRELAQTDNQVQAKVCLQLLANVENFQSTTTLKLKFKLDPQFGRALFHSDKTNERIWEVQVSEARHCEDFELSIRTKLEYIFRPLELELHYENLQRPPATSPGESS